jgi:hypothetical protein
VLVVALVVAILGVVTEQLRLDQQLAVAAQVH